MKKSYKYYINSDIKILNTDFIFIYMYINFDIRKNERFSERFSRIRASADSP